MFINKSIPFVNVCKLKQILRGVLYVLWYFWAVVCWKRNGYSPRKNILEKIADYFQVSADYLIGESEQKEIPADKGSEDMDIAVELEEMMQKLESDGSLMFDGNPASPEAIRSIKTALEMGLRYARDIEKGKSK